MLGRHHPVLAGPGDQRRPGETGSRSAAGSRKRVSAAAARSIRTVSRRIAGLGQDRPHPPGRGGVAALGQPAERDRQPPDRPQPHLLHEQAEQRRRQLARPAPASCRSGRAGSCRTRRTRRAPPGPIRASPSAMSSWTSAPPVSLPTRVTSRRPSRSRNSAASRAIPGSDRSASARIGVPVRPERQRRRHAPVAGGQPGDHLVPQRGVHQQPVQQHDHRPVAAGVLVLDRPGRQLDLLHGRPPHCRARSAGTASGCPSRCRAQEGQLGRHGRAHGPSRNGA